MFHEAFNEGREIIKDLPYASVPAVTCNDDNIKRFNKNYENSIHSFVFG